MDIDKTISDEEIENLALKDKYWGKENTFAWHDFGRDLVDLTRQQLAKQTSGEPVAEVIEDKLADWSTPHASVKWLQDDFPIGTKFYTKPPSVEVLLEALRKIANAPLINGTSIQAIATDALSTYSNPITVKED
jgi:hypothetical protein